MGSLARAEELAFVLEGVPGVEAVYSVDGCASAKGCDYAVQIASPGYHVAAAHCALLRIWPREECARVHFCRFELPPSLAARARRVVLDDGSRQQTRLRVAARIESGDERMSTRACTSVLVVDDDPEVPVRIEEGLMPGRIVVERDPTKALDALVGERFLLCFCDTNLAFGDKGLLEQVVAQDAFLAATVVLLTSQEDAALTTAALDALGLYNAYLLKPVRVESLARMLETGQTDDPWSVTIRAPWTMPVHEPRRRSMAGSRFRVLVVDDDPLTLMRLRSASVGEIDVVVADDTWTSLDHASTETFDALLCSPSMRTVTGAPLYRLLWNAVPSIKTRTFFIASDSGPRAASRADRVVTRPIAPQALLALARRAR